jgi:hypothetical protein
MLMNDGRVDPMDLDNSALNWATDSGHNDVVDILMRDA